MGKAKNRSVETSCGETRKSVRLAMKPQKTLAEIKTRKPSAGKKAPKQKKAKSVENGSSKAEEPKAEATEAK